MPLRLHPTIQIPHGASSKTQIIQYEVLGLPPKVEILIGLFEGRWKMRRTERGLPEPWTGSFETAEAALASIQDEG